jgi:hypothetical protein
VTIPRALRFNRMITITWDGEPHELRLMEVIVLTALLRIARPGESSGWYDRRAADILIHGWNGTTAAPLP